MKVLQATVAMMMASLTTPLIAASVQVGTLTAASQGTFVAREGRMIPARAGQTLFAGDRVFTRGGAKAKVAMSGCSYTLAPTSVLAVGTGACSAVPRSMALQDTDNSGIEGAAAMETSTSAGTFIVGIAALAAIGAGIYVVADEDGSPASP